MVFKEGAELALFFHLPSRSRAQGLGGHSETLQFSRLPRAKQHK